MASRASSSATSAGRIRRGRRGTATERRQKRIKKRRGCTRTRSEDDEEDGVSGESYVRGRKGGGGEGRRRKGVTVHRGVLPPPDAAANQSRRKREGGVDGRTDGGRRGERVVGIDLGTTNSAIALTSGSRSERGGIAGGAAAKRRDGVEIVADANGQRTTPSVVSFGGEDNSGRFRAGSCPVSVGESALRRAGSAPLDTFHSVKRFIGRTMTDVMLRAGDKEGGGRGGGGTGRALRQMSATALREDLRVKFDVRYGIASAHSMTSAGSGGMSDMQHAGNDTDDVMLVCPALQQRSDTSASTSESNKCFDAVGHSTGGFLRPQDVSAYVLRKLLDDAEHAEREDITKAVITVPAYFDDKQMAATVEAGRIAGLDVVKTIREPMAAALSYGLDGKSANDERVMVFDLGGGTLDVSVLEIGGGSVEVRSCGGDAFLGGDDFDERVCEWMGEEICRANGLGRDEWRAFPASQRRRLMEGAEAMKRRLTEDAEVAVNVRGLGREGKASNAHGLEAELRLTRGKFEKMCDDLLLRCRDPMEQACAQAGIDLERMRVSASQLRKRKGQRPSEREMRAWRKDQPITEVILVGGATRMPAIHRFVQNATGIKPKWTVNPDEVVAEGAAIQAGIFEGEINNLFVMDTWQASLMRALAERQGYS